MNSRVGARAGALVAMVVAVLLGLGLVPPPAQAAGKPVNTSAPRIVGTPVYGDPVRVDRGTWQGAQSFAYQWLRDGKAIRGADAPRYRPRKADIGHRLTVRVAATSADGQTATSKTRAKRVRAAPMVNRKRPRIKGAARFGKTLRATTGKWSPKPAKVRYRWLRGKRVIRGAHHRRYQIRPADVGKRIRVQVGVRADGHRWGKRASRKVKVKHRVGVRRTVKYRVITRGKIHANVRKFKRLAQQTYTDPRGWRAAGVRFRRVAKGGAFTLVLANARSLPSFSSGCSVKWSCRVGRYVIINQNRWQRASPAWNRGGKSLRGYRHMVVNHETGHWLGLGHRSCPGAGKKAPLMMQQSKGRAGCRFNSWPLPSERRAAR